MFFEWLTPHDMYLHSCICIIRGG